MSDAEVPPPAAASGLELAADEVDSTEDTLASSEAPLEPRAFDAGWLLQGLIRSAITQVAATASGFFTSIIIARATGPEGKGLVTLLLASLALPAILVNPGLGQAAQVQLLREPHRARMIVSFITLYCTLVGSAVGGILVLYREPFARTFLEGRAAHLVWIVALMLPASMLIQSMSQLLIASDRVRLRNRFQIAQSVLGLVLLIVTVLAVRADVTGILVAIVVAGVGTAIAMTSAVIRIHGFTRSFDKVVLGDLFRFGFRHHPSTLATVVSKRLEYFFLAGLMGLSAVGVYSVAAAMIDIVLMAPRTLMELAIPVFVGGDRLSSARTAARVIRVGWGAALLVGAPLYLAASVAIPLFFGPGFQSALPLFGILLATFVLFPLGPLALQFLVARRRLGSVTAVYLLAAVVNIGLSWFLISTIGLSGNALASVGYFLVMAIAGILLFHRFAPELSITELVPRKGDVAAVKYLLGQRGR